MEFDPYAGRDVPIIVGVWNAKNDFTLDVVIRTSYEALGEEKAQQNTFKTKYVIDPEFYVNDLVFIDSDNYRINVQKFSGKWQ